MIRKNLTKEINIFFNSYRIGSPDSRAKRKSVLHLIISELSSLGILPQSFSHIKTTHVKKLIEHWEQAHVSNNTIINRVGILRHFLSHAFKVEIESNQQLSLTYDERKKSIAQGDGVLEYVHHPVTKTVLAFQLYFGLTKGESIRIILPVAIQDDDLVVSRSIASNSKDRFIPIKTKQQRDVIAYRYDVLGKHRSLTEKMPETLILSLYHAELYDCGIDHKHAFRKFYAANRLGKLLETKDHSASKRVLREELGYVNNQVMESGLL